MDIRSKCVKVKRAPHLGLLFQGRLFNPGIEGWLTAVAALLLLPGSRLQNDWGKLFFSPPVQATAPAPPEALNVYEPAFSNSFGFSKLLRLQDQQKLQKHLRLRGRKRETWTPPPSPTELMPPSVCLRRQSLQFEQSSCKPGPPPGVYACMHASVCDYLPL